MSERAPWDWYVQGCCECDEGYLEPRADTDDDPERAAVICSNCEVEFRLVAVPIDRPTDGTCPDCGATEFGTEDDWSLRCESCDAHWRIEEISWLSRVDDD